MERLNCPGCGTALEEAGRTSRCTSCDGAWVHEDVLVGMLQERTSTMVSLPWHPRPKDHERPCAICTTPMQTVSLGTVALDRCTEHGVWFDASELAALIAQAKQFKSSGHDDDDAASADSGETERRGLLGALARLFGG